MDVSDIISSGDNKTARRKKIPVKVPWMIGGGGDTDDWTPPRCRPDSGQKAKHKYEAIIRSRAEAKKLRVAQEIMKERKRRQPIVTFPSEANVLRKVESPFAIPETDLLQSYYCRPPKVSQSLIELLDKYFDPLERGFHPSYLDLPPIQTEPTVKFTDTATTLQKSKRLKQDAKLKKVERDKISHLIRTRIKGLKRLRDGYQQTENRYKCHYTERKNAKIEEKKNYAKKLAEKYNYPAELLESRTDSLYDKYIESKKEKSKSEKDYVEKTLEWMERLLQEEQKLEKLEKPPKPFVVRKKPKPPEPEPIVLEYQPSLKTIVEERAETEEEKTGEKETDSSKRRQSSKKSSRRASRRASRRSSRRASRRASRRSSRRASRRASRGASKRASKKGGKASKTSLSKKSKKGSKDEPKPLEPYVQLPPTSVLDPELVEMFRKWEEKRLEVERMKIKEKSLPVDTAYYTKPNCILINNFQPNAVYTRRVKLINRSKKRAVCRPYMIKMHPDDDIGLLKVDPWTMLSSPPGIYPVVTVTFSPTESTGRVEADVIFLSRHPPKSWKSFSFHVTCIPPSPQISVEPTFFKFPPKKIWSQDVLIEHFTVTNKGMVPCTMFVRRKDELFPCDNCEEVEMYEEDVEDIHQIRIDSTFCIYPTVKFMSLKEKKKDKPKRRLRRELINESTENESEEIAENIVERLFNKVFETFTIDRRYEIEIPGKSRVRVSLVFKPRFAKNLGTVQEPWCLMFTDFAEFCLTKTIEIFAQIESTPLYVKPLVLDMSLCLLENGVQQQNFIVGNRGRRGHTLVIRVPPAMANQAFIHNPGPLVLGGEEVKILVRLDLKYSFCAESSEFYDHNTNILDFPVYVSSKDEDETGPPLEVRVMAIVTRSMGLQVAPSLINFGVVYTYQSAVAPFYLSNHTLATHKFAFLNLPQWVMIEPGYGFGVIRAGERLKLDLIYSPTQEQIAWPGGCSEHFFILVVTTMDRLANHQPLHKLISTDHHHERLFPEDYEVREEDYPPSVEEKKETEVSEPVDDGTRKKKSSLGKKKSIAAGKKSIVSGAKPHGS